MNPDPQEVASAAALWKTKLANDAWISKMLAKYDHGGTGKLETDEVKVRTRVQYDWRLLRVRHRRGF